MALKRSLAWMGAAQVAAFAVQFAASVVVARYLTPREMGVYAAAAAVVGSLSIIQSLGLQSLVVREEQLTPDIRATAFTVNAIISIVLATLIAAVSVLGGWFIGDTGIERALLGLSIGPLIGIFGFLPSATLERHGEFWAMSIAGTSSGLVAAIGTIAFAVLGFSYMSIVYASWAGAATYNLLINLFGWRHASFRLGVRAWRRVADFGLQMFAVSGVTSLTTRLSELAIGRLLGLSALGIYGRASNLNGLIWNNIHLVAGRVLFVDFADLNRRGVSLRDRYLRTVEITSAVLWPAFGGLAVLAGPFIFNVYGARWLPAAAPLALLAVASILQVASTLTWELFAATGNLRVQTRIEFIRSLLSLTAFVIGCTISLTAAAAARVFDALIGFLLYRPHLNRMTETSLRDFASVYARSALLTVLAVGPSAAITAEHAFSARTRLSLVLAGIACGVIFWVVGLLVLNHPLVQEIRTSVANLSVRWRRRAARTAA